MLEKGKRRLAASSNKRTEIIEYLLLTLVGAMVIVGVERPSIAVATFGFCAVFLIFCSFERAFYLVFFLVPFATVFKTSVSGTSLFTYLELVLAVRIIWQYRKGYNARFLISLMIFAAYVLLGSQLQFTTIIKQLMIPLLIYGFFQCDQLTNKKVLFVFTWGLILSSIFAQFREYIPNLSDYIILNRAYELGQNVYRTSGLYSDPNYYSVALIMASCGLLSQFVGKRIGIWVLLLVAVLTAFGAGTISKSFILMLIVELALFVLILFVRKRYALGAVSLLLVFVLVLAMFAGKIELFENVINRLLVSTEDIQSLTTGRVQGWGMYLNAILEENFVAFFVGRGIGADYATGVYAAHNTYLDFLYYYGILGSGLFVFTCYAACPVKKAEKRGLLNSYCWIVLLLMIMFLSYLKFYDFAFVLILAISNFRENFQQPVAEEIGSVSVKKRFKAKWRML